MDVSVLHCSRCCRVNTPDSIELAMAGVCAAILVAACQDTAVELLTWPGRPRPAAIAITGVPPVLRLACRRRVQRFLHAVPLCQHVCGAALHVCSGSCMQCGCVSTCVGSSAAGVIRMPARCWLFGPICSARPALERAKL